MPELKAQIEKAFDYRGDVTLERKDGTRVVGFVFNHEPKSAPRCSEPFVELFVEGKPDPILVKIRDIAAVHLTGEDTAAGKSWEEWQAKQAAKKLQGR